MNFANAAALSTTATFGAAGSYVLRLTASDSLLASSADVTITVNAASGVNQAPQVNAGANQSIVLPATASLDRQCERRRAAESAGCTDLCVDEGLRARHRDLRQRRERRNDRELRRRRQLLAAADGERQCARRRRGRGDHRERHCPRRSASRTHRRSDDRAGRSLPAVGASHGAEHQRSADLRTANGPHGCRTQPRTADRLAPHGRAGRGQRIHGKGHRRSGTNRDDDFQGHGHARQPAAATAAAGQRDGQHRRHVQPDARGDRPRCRRHADLFVGGRTLGDDADRRQPQLADDRPGRGRLRGLGEGDRRRRLVRCQAIHAVAAAGGGAGGER